MTSPILDLKCRLARDAEAVCRYYLPSGSRQGRHWIVGDVRNTPGRSMFVRLFGPDMGRGAAGKWTDAATGEHGDLLDIIAVRSGYDDFRMIVDEARRFLRLPRSDDADSSMRPNGPTSIRSSDAAFRLFAMARPIAGSLVETYLRARHIDYLDDVGSLRFHPRCYYRPSYGRPCEAWPAMIASVTDLSGILTGVHRTWLDPSGLTKAPLRTPRRAMGNLLGKRCPLRRLRRRPRRRRGDRNHAVAPLCHARDADGGGAVGSASFRVAVSARAAPALYRAGQRSRRRRRGGDAARSSLASRNRGDSARATARGFQRGSPPAWACAVAGTASGSAFVAGHRALSANRGLTGTGKGGVLILPSSRRCAADFVRAGGAHGLLKRATFAASGPAAQWRMPAIFRRRLMPPLHREAK